MKELTMSSIAQVPAAAEPPLIRQPVRASTQRNGLARTGQKTRTTNGDLVVAAVRDWAEGTTASGRRWLWVRKKLYGPSLMNGARAGLAAVLMVTLNPAVEAQAAVVSSEPETAAIELTAEPAAVHTELVASLTADGVSPKPLILATEIGLPERELKEQEAREAAERARLERERQQRAAIARAEAQRQVQTARRSTRATTTARQQVTPTARQGVASPGNTYAYGYCTWWVKAKRPDLPNQLGNANAWLSSAWNTGLATGSAPRPGAAVVTSEGPIGHVAYVEAVEGDEIVISEMNYSGWNRTNTRRISADSGAIRGYIY
jgi:surface antigen